MYPILLTGDIRQAFLQIEIDPTDRDVLRFFWLKDRNGPQEEIEELRFTHAIFGAGPSPYILAGTVENHLKKYEDNDRAIVKKIRDSLYVDDFIGGENTSQATMNLKEKVETIFKEGGFTMTKWKANNKEVLSKLDGSEFGSDQTIILGIPWNPETDEISIGIHQPTTNIITKRTLLSELSKTFDPLGIVGPMMMKALPLLQKLCLNEVGWDDPLTDEQKENWRKWLTELAEVQRVTIPRAVAVIVDKEQPIILHGFGDASKDGYCAVIYLVADNEGEKSCNILTAKTRLAPPRLELIAGRTLAKLVNTVENALDEWNIVQTNLWLDSQTVLHWLENRGQWKVFVTNWVKEIHQLTPNAQWRYCPTFENPSDIGKRGVTPKQLSNNDLWWFGPKFLLNDINTWPEQPDTLTVSVEGKYEERNTTLLIKTEGSLSISQVINIERYSNIKRLERVTALVIRFIRNYYMQERKISEKADHRRTSNWKNAMGSRCTTTSD